MLQGEIEQDVVAEREDEVIKKADILSAFFLLYHFQYFQGVFVKRIHIRDFYFFVR